MTAPMTDPVSSRPTIRGAAAVVGLGATPMYTRGEAPGGELAMAVDAVRTACAVAGISPRDIDGVASYGSERNSGPRMAASLGFRELRWSSLVWDGGGGGVAASIGAAAAAIATGQAEIVAVVRSLVEADGGRLRDDVSRGHFDLQYLVNGINSPAQICALRTQRLLHLGVPRSALAAVAEVSYRHAANNPSAYARDIEWNSDIYEQSRWVSEPLRLFDCSRENDGAAAVVLVAGHRAADFADRPAFVLAAPQGAPANWGDVGESVEPYESAGFSTVAQRLWDESRYGPDDIRVAQVYDNFTGPAVAAVIDHGFTTIKGSGEFFTVDNLLAPHGRLAFNTAGGNMGEGFIHGMSLVVEAIRQIRDESPNQVPGADLSLLTGGPASPLVSSALFGSATTL